MKKTCKSYKEDGVQYQFDNFRLKMFIEQKKGYLKKANLKVTQEMIRDELAEHACVSSEAIKNWTYGYNAPSDLEQIKVLAEYFEVDYHQLLREEKAMTSAAEVRYDLTNDEQKQYTRTIVRGIYQGIINLLDKMEDYDWRFTWLDEEEPDSLFNDENKELVKDAYREMNGMRRDLVKQLRYSLLDLPVDFYHSMKEYLDEELYAMIKGIADIDIDRYKSDDDRNDYLHSWAWASLQLEEEVVEERLRQLFADYIVVQ